MYYATNYVLTVLKHPFHVKSVCCAGFVVGTVFQFRGKLSGSLVFDHAGTGFGDGIYEDKSGRKKEKDKNRLDKLIMTLNNDDNDRALFFLHFLNYQVRSCLPCVPTRINGMSRMPLNCVIFR